MTVVVAVDDAPVLSVTSNDTLHFAGTVMLAVWISPPGAATMFAVAPLKALVTAPGQESVQL